MVPIAPLIYAHLLEARDNEGTCLLVFVNTIMVGFI